jgi:hypothetical protein
MRAIDYWHKVVKDKSNFLDDFLALLNREAISFCVIGGQAVNAYAEPLVSLDLDIVIALDQIDDVVGLLKEHYIVQAFPHSINISSYASDLRIQIQTDSRYFEFLNQAEDHPVLGITLPVASLKDTLHGKIWAAQDPERRPSKRQKDLADIARLIEVYPYLKSDIPPEILAQLV